jgi:aminopeptidase N
MIRNGFLTIHETRNPFKVNTKIGALWLAFFLFALLACQPEKQKPESMTADPHSFSRPHEATATHLSWSATVDFTTKSIAAIATWSVEQNNDGIIVFDTKELSISKVTGESGEALSFNLNQQDSILGQALEVTLKPGTKKISIEYKTNPEAEALQWLHPQQTADKRQPFLFTQSQAILARSWIPCQDSPGVRFTYDAKVTVPKDLLALMSASNPQQKNDSGVYYFEMKQPIPSYLLALAVGDIAFKAISNRSGVYAEPSIVDTATWEFGDLEKMITGAEELYGPYRWDRYDVIVLPPSFPFGGMENPRLTFATPTILAGDRSLTSLIAHELAHSWSGNLVTNATWNDFWLNEGFTVYFETRIMEKLYGKSHAEMLASLNLQDLKSEIKSLNEKGLEEDTKLKLDLVGRNPDDGVTDVAYNKGYYFLRSIEEEYGREKFDAFVKDYFSENAFKAMDTDRFISFIKNYYNQHFNISLDDKLFQSWIYSEGIPSDCPSPQSDRFAKVDDALNDWRHAGKLQSSASKEWSTQEWLHFINNLPDSLSQSEMTTLDTFGNFTHSGNSEIIAAWGVHVIRNNYEQAFQKIESFLIHTGRRKFLLPLYEEMIKTPEGTERAKEIYQKARPNYHYVATSSLDVLIN